MHTVVPLFSLFLAAVGAQRVCQSAYPSDIDILIKSNPDEPSTPGLQFTLDRSGTPLENTEISAMTFQIPQGSTGCELVVDFGVPLNNQIARGDVDAEIWRTAPFNGNRPTWNHQAEKVAMVGTFQFPTAPLTNPIHTTIASDSCEPEMSFQVELKSTQQHPGWVNFVNLRGFQGFQMLYDCR